MDQDELDEDVRSQGTSYSLSLLRTGAGAAAIMTVENLLKDMFSWSAPTEKSKTEEIPYEPINRPRQPSKPTLSNGATPVASTSASTLEDEPPNAASTSKSPFFPTIDRSTAWHRHMKVGSGFHNSGNTCFLNSALQALVHTPPVVRYLAFEHDTSKCKTNREKNFCMSCCLKQVIVAAFNGKPSFTPVPFTRNLKKIAPHFRPGRQEDSHEFLRFVVDGLQNSEVWDKPKLSTNLKHTTWVHQVFGGKLRSRVHCMSCGHSSDTFDSILDLSVDLQRANDLEDALRNLVKKDLLRGANKYKCEKCKRLVEAEKNFTIDDPPLVLTVHLKRFRANGSKNNDAIAYPERLDLGPYLSDPGQGPHYRLYSVVHHSGGGPHSGHYIAHVKSGDGTWHEMDDSYVSGQQRAPLNKKTAYMLFYAREQGDALHMAIHGNGAASTSTPKSNGVHSNGNNASGKRSRESDELSMSNGSPANKKVFIGPQQPSPQQTSSTPQAYPSYPGGGAFRPASTFNSPSTAPAAQLANGATPFGPSTSAPTRNEVNRVAPAAQKTISDQSFYGAPHKGAAPDLRMPPPNNRHSGLFHPRTQAKRAGLGIAPKKSTVVQSMKGRSGSKPAMLR